MISRFHKYSTPKSSLINPNPITEPQNWNQLQISGCNFLNSDFLLATDRQIVMTTLSELNDDIIRSMSVGAVFSDFVSSSLLNLFNLSLNSYFSVDKFVWITATRIKLAIMLRYLCFTTEHWLSFYAIW